MKRILSFLLALAIVPACLHFGGVFDGFDMAVPSTNSAHAGAQNQIGTITAKKLRGQLRHVEVIDDRPDPGGYDRDAQFGSDWIDGDNACDTRNDVLGHDLTDRTYESGTGRCVVVTGVLSDPYTGEHITFDGAEDPNAIQIDHIYPLSTAWDMGASSWSQQRRVAFANDQHRNLIAVDGPENMSKSDQGLADWLPPNQAFTCEYLYRYLRVARHYSLPITEGDTDVVRAEAPHCTKADQKHRKVSHP